MCELIKEIACGGDLQHFEPPGELEARLGPIAEMWSPEQASPEEWDEEERPPLVRDAWS
jgi:hypothetical protein